jgi:hypothetical protein
MNSQDPFSRRRFINAAAALGAAAKAGGEVMSDPSSVPKVRFGKTEITRVIIGSNPLYGYSHFNPLLNQFMKDYMTDDRRMEILLRAEKAGINTWQVHYTKETMADLKRYRSMGGKMNWFLLGHGEMMADYKLAYEAAKLGPIGIAHHGNRTDDLFRDRKIDQVKEFCKVVRDTGVMVGVSCHNPAVVDFIEGAGWDIDYYMTCMYRVSRTHEEARQQYGEAPIGEIYMEKDPERMTKMVRATKRPCLAFKIFGAGRTTGNRQQVENSFKFVYGNIKPGDACIVGMCPRFKDEIAENVEMAVRFGQQRA